VIEILKAVGQLSSGGMSSTERKVEHLLTTQGEE
jgi:hypothetical protein